MMNEPAATLPTPTNVTSRLMLSMFAAPRGALVDVVVCYGALLLGALAIVISIHFQRPGLGIAIGIIGWSVFIGLNLALTVSWNRWKAGLTESARAAVLVEERRFRGRAVRAHLIGAVVLCAAIAAYYAAMLAMHSK